MVKLPTPRIVEEKFYQLHGLYTDLDSDGWDTTWRNYRASLFHLSLHAAFSDFKAYGPWAKGKDIAAATFAVSLVEDVNITAGAKAKWAGVLADLAHANYTSALRLPEPDDVEPSALRFAATALLASAGVFLSSGANIVRDEDDEVSALAATVGTKVEEAVNSKARKGRRFWRRLRKMSIRQ